MDEIIRKDTTFKNKVNEAITAELKVPNETEIALEANKEELCLPKGFGAAKLLGSGKSTTNNPSACDNLRDKSKLNKSHATTETRAPKTTATHATPTWTHKERSKLKDNTATSFQSQGKRRVVGSKADHTEISAKRFLATLSEEDTFCSGRS